MQQQPVELSHVDSQAAALLTNANLLSFDVRHFSVTAGAIHLGTVLEAWGIRR
jgi:hypothetical protein